MASRMFAVHDQENLAALQQSAAHSKQQQQQQQNPSGIRALQPKTPGARHPKTPLRIPLNDENGVHTLGGAKSVLGNASKPERSQWVTPAEARTSRAVLGDKTTNAKAKHNQSANPKTPGLRDAEKSQAKPTTVSRPKSQASKSDGSRLRILLDAADPLSGEADVNPPPPPLQPYQSDVFPAGILTFDAIKPTNRLKGYFDYYHNRKDENGMTRVDREAKAAQDKRFRDAEAQIQRDDDELTWDLGLESPKKPAPLADPIVKATPRSNESTKAPSTLNARRAASALGMVSRASSRPERRPISATVVNSPTKSKLPSFMQTTKARQAAKAALAPRPKAIQQSTSSNIGAAASRSTLGYNKGRSVSQALREQALSTEHTPSRRAKDNVAEKPEFVSIFDGPPDGERFGLSLGGDSGWLTNDDTVTSVARHQEDEDAQMDLD
ncbi:hypothetical protein BD289DRAFT_478779 [Coniella lustricola]|uniref:Uncharacterized protein n=1 Tax=Coniella lustricola TaxID=2025994 RepID=A0A2T3AKZ9_9PEZI|nr:hypothetical protein BD289DRAFT_478779 [Coniella lustricola]